MEDSREREPVIRLRNVTVAYDDHIALEGVNLTIHAGDFVGIIGPNGGGKTTLLKVILGLVKPLRGEVEVLGVSPREARQKVGYVPQSVEFDPDFPIQVLDVVRMGCLKFRRFEKGRFPLCHSRVETVMRQMEVWSLRDRQMGRLSGGEKQRVFIARALVTEPEILLLDEPTASVDSRIRTTIYEILSRLNTSMTICLVSHDIGVISSRVKTVACLNQRLFYHGEKELTEDILMTTYRCPVDLIAHGVPHRVLKDHGK
ncbi:MAG: ABC transporter [Deltaproteobacteria bacterium]|nr:MAG: ABC transporter [Deltaproteobacteria bacterium]